VEGAVWVTEFTLGVTVLESVFQSTTVDLAKKKLVFRKRLVVENYAEKALTCAKMEFVVVNSC
jgi:hypothetical protein